MRTEELITMLNRYINRGVVSTNFEIFILYANKITDNGERAVDIPSRYANLRARKTELRFMRANLSRMREFLSQAPQRYETLCAGMEDLCQRYEQRYEQKVNSILNKMESLTAK